MRRVVVGCSRPTWTPSGSTSTTSGSTSTTSGSTWPASRPAWTREPLALGPRAARLRPRAARLGPRAARLGPEPLDFDRAPPDSAARSARLRAADREPPTWPASSRPAWTRAARLRPRAARLGPRAARLTPRAARLGPRAARLGPEPPDLRASRSAPWIARRSRCEARAPAAPLGTRSLRLGVRTGLGTPAEPPGGLCDTRGTRPPHGWTNTTVPVSARATPVPPRRDLRLGPEEEAPRVLRRQVHAAVALRRAEHVVPVGAVERVAVLEVLDVGHVAELELLADHVRVHRDRDVLRVDPEDAALRALASFSGSPSPASPLETSVA